MFHDMVLVDLEPGWYTDARDLLRRIDTTYHFTLSATDVARNTKIERNIISILRRLESVGEAHHKLFEDAVS